MTRNSWLFLCAALSAFAVFTFLIIAISGDWDVKLLEIGRYSAVILVGIGLGCVVYTYVLYSLYLQEEQNKILNRLLAKLK